MRHTLTNELQPTKQRGHYIALPDGAEAQFIARISRQAGENQSIIRTAILHYYAESLGQLITGGWVNSFTGCHLTDLFDGTSSPQEDPRPQVPRIFLPEALRCMERAVGGFFVIQYLTWTSSELQNGWIAKRNRLSSQRRSMARQFIAE
jgi:hypothetical protein